MENGRIKWKMFVSVCFTISAILSLAYFSVTITRAKLKNKSEPQKSMEHTSTRKKKSGMQHKILPSM